MKKIKLLKKPKKNNSFKWLDRHLNDEYFLKSKKEGFRSRSSYKLLQIDEKFQFLKKSKLILDLGCSPGGWLQVALMNAPKDSMILGLDKLDLKKIDGVSFLKMDIFDKTALRELNRFFGNKKIDLILSDMSPNSSGNKSVDHLRIISLVEKVLEFSKNILKANGFLVSKIFQGGAQGQLVDEMKKELYEIKYFKPKASRPESIETYLVAKKIKK